MRIRLLLFMFPNSLFRQKTNPMLKNTIESSFFGLSFSYEFNIINN